jgi:NADH-quinone oxidoreductase subunit J
METAFYIAGVVAIVATLMVITRHNPVHALLYLNVSLLAHAMLFYLLGASFAALLEIIIYAGAIMVLFIFVVMLLNLGKETAGQERKWLKMKVWVGPTLLAAVLFAEFLALVLSSEQGGYSPATVSPREVALSLFREYLIGVELAAMLLMAAVVGAAHIGRHKRLVLHRFLKEENEREEEKHEEVVL